MDKDIMFLILYDIIELIKGKLLKDQKFYSVYGLMSNDKKNKYYSMENELHRVWNFVNTQQGSVDDYVRLSTRNTKHPIQNPELFDFLYNHNIAMKQEITQEFKDAVIQIFGINDFNRLFGDKIVTL